jgi:prephenate dehydratase
MTMQFHRIVLFSTLLLATPGIMRSQDRPISVPTLTQSEAESLLKDLASHEEAWEQSCRHIAAIYREMAVISEADSTAVRELKRQYERLAEHEEKAAAMAVEKIATYRARLSVPMHYSQDVAKPHYVSGDAAYRK